jgi:hypothetical protein
MAKIYETPDDLQRDVLLKQRQESAIEANGSFANAPIFLIVGGFSRMLNQAKSYMVEMPESKLWKIVGNSSLLTGIEWISYAFAIKSLIQGISSSNKKNKFNNQLTSIGEKEEIIVKEKNGGDRIVYDSSTNIGKLIKKNDEQLPNQAITTIQSSTAHAERMQDLNINSKIL